MSVLTQVKGNELVFKAKLAKMGDHRIIWIPIGLREMIRDFEGEELMVTIKKSKAK